MSLWQPIRTTVLAGLLACVAGVSVARAETPSAANRADIQAAYLYRFLFFVTFPEQRDPAVFCTLDSEDMNKALGVFAAHAPDNRSFVVRDVGLDDDLRSCDMLFVGELSIDERIKFFQSVAGAPVLTVCESRWFLKQGGMVRFLFVDDRVRFELNQDAAEAAGLKLSAQLLALSHRESP